MSTGFYIGPLYVHFYGIILMVAALAGAVLASYEAKRKGYDPEIVWDGLVWLLVGGIVGARIWHILTPPPSMVEQGITTYYYLTHPLAAIAVWKGGLGIPGAVIGGLIALYFFVKKKQISFLVGVDIAAPALALGQAIGRWGNYVNQELYGRPTDLPWGIFIEPKNRIPGFEQFEKYHPLFLYESIWNLGNMIFLLWLSRHYEKKLKDGDVFFVYLIVYPFGRFLLEFLRLDASQISGINANQTLMLIVMIFAIAVLIWRHRKGSSTANGNGESIGEQATD